MKKFSLSILITICLLAAWLPARAQTADTNMVPITGNTALVTTMPQFITDMYNVAVGSGLTNFSFTTGVTYTPSAEALGWFMALHRNLAIGGGAFVAPGAGLEFYGGSWYTLQLSTTLGVDLRPLIGWTNVLGSTIGNLVMTPITSIGMETPFGGGSGSISGTGAFIVAGGAVRLFTVPWLKSDFSLGGTVGSRTGFSSSDPSKNFNGKFYTGFATLLWKF